MVNHWHQLSFKETFEECKEFFQNDKPKFLNLLTENINLCELIPLSFYHRYYKILGRDRKYSLLAMLSALVLQKILGIPYLIHLKRILFYSMTVNLKEHLFPSTLVIQTQDFLNPVTTKMDGRSAP
jgi:hypothetical protein